MKIKIFLNKTKILIRIGLTKFKKNPKQMMDPHNMKMCIKMKMNHLIMDLKWTIAMKTI